MTKRQERCADTPIDEKERLLRMMDQPREALRGWTLTGLVDSSQAAPLREFLRSRLEDSPRHATSSLEVALHCRGDGVLAVRLDASTEGAAKGTMLVAFHDLRAAKRAECASAEVARKDEFLCALSHELRNPLFPISNGLVLLERFEPGSAEGRQAMATVRRQVSHLAHIVDDLLDVTRIARGKVNLRREPFDLAALVQRTLEDHAPEFQSRRIALESQLGSEPVWVEADRTRIVQVIGNLLVNASKFTSGGGRVDVGVRREGNQAVLSVRDNGVGISADVRDRLFIPFSQAPQTLDRSRGGLGLGLAMVKGLVELHGGTVDVTSEGPGRGSAFTVRLPRIEPPAPRAEPAGRAATHCASRRVLVIDDNVDAADTMRVLLASEGHAVRAAYDGATGVALAREFHPEIVFCDIGLPGMDGFEVARAMRAEGELADTCLVALSGYAGPEDRKRSAAAGFDWHLAKPPSISDVEHALEGCSPFGMRRF